jgi:hypothetical protein
MLKLCLREVSFWGNEDKGERVGHCDNIYVLYLGQARIGSCLSQAKKSNLDFKREIIP